MAFAKNQYVDPWQKTFDGGAVETVTLAGKMVLTTMVIQGDIAGLLLTHGILEVSWQHITSPFCGMVIKTALVLPV